MIWFKSCSRCKQGDMTLDEDGDRLCLQCGHVQRSVAAPAAVAALANLVDVGEEPTRSAPAVTARREVIFAA